MEYQFRNGRYFRFRLTEWMRIRLFLSNCIGRIRQLFSRNAVRKALGFRQSKSINSTLSKMLKAHVEAENSLCGIDTSHMIDYSVMLRTMREQDSTHYLIGDANPALRSHFKTVEHQEKGVFTEQANNIQAEGTGKKVSVDDLDELFAEIDELTKEEGDTP